MAATEAVTTTVFRSYTYFLALRLRFRVAARERFLVKRAFRMESRAMTAVIRLTTEVASLIASSMLM
ncbi:hypothetical protein AR689_21330 [Arthrobacter sp. EpRS71]|nr:hypothetical protein AR689_21330 [Arthrobacter sp. EpRS71]